MALITKPDMEFIWASGGAVVKPSDVKIQTGWTPEVPPHQWENWVQRRQDEFIAHVNQRGIPQWDGNTEYEAGGLSYAQGSDGIIYKSVSASGPSTTVQDPTTDVSDTYWTVAFADFGTFITEADGDLRYAQRENNLSDLSSAATAFANIKQAATTSATGVVELATDAEVATGTSTTLVPSVASLMSVFGKRVFTTNDYIRIPDVPGGLIVQFGAGTGAGTGTVNFPIAFPNAVLYCGINDRGDASVTPAYAAVNPGLSSFTWKQNAVANIDSFYWLAIGY